MAASYMRDRLARPCSLQGAGTVPGVADAQCEQARPDRGTLGQPAGNQPTPMSRSTLKAAEIAPGEARHGFRNMNGRDGFFSTAATGEEADRHDRDALYSAWTLGIV